MCSMYLFLTIVGELDFIKYLNDIFFDNFFLIKFNFLSFPKQLRMVTFLQKLDIFFAIAITPPK